MDQYKSDRLDELIRLEVAKLQGNNENNSIPHLHPEVKKCLGKLDSIRSDKKRESSPTSDETSSRSNKRLKTETSNKINDDEQEIQNHEGRIDLHRYDSESTDINLLQSMHSYLDHQIITLQDGLLDKTIATQWAINNEFQQTNLNITQRHIELQRKHLNQLNKLMGL